MGDVLEFKLRKAAPPEAPPEPVLHYHGQAIAQDNTAGPVSPVEIWAQDEPTEEMVWAMCKYVNGCSNCSPTECAQCPRFYKTHQGPMQSGCYGRAAEACRVVMAFMNRPAPGA